MCREIVWSIMNKKSNISIAKVTIRTCTQNKLMPHAVDRLWGNSLFIFSLCKEKTESIFEQIFRLMGVGMACIADAL